MGTLSEEEKLAQGSSNTLAKFAAFVASETDLKKVLKSNFSLDPAASL